MTVIWFVVGAILCLIALVAIDDVQEEARSRADHDEAGRLQILPAAYPTLHRSRAAPRARE